MTHTDIRKKAWIERFPARARPFLYLIRADRPVGTWLLLSPALWSITLAGGINAHTMPLLVLFALGAFIMRGAGCVINDLWDKDLDQKVERTASRPLASGVLTTKDALICLGVLLALGLCILIQMNITTIALGVFSLLLVIAYPLMKRITWWPQAFLGITFNFGAIMGWSAVTGTLHLPAILLYIGGFFWTLGYDTIYACQDVKDDALIGVKSTARLLEKNIKRWVFGFYSAATLFLLMGVYAGAGGMAAAVCLPAFILLTQQAKNFNPDNKALCLKHFKANSIFGVVLWICIMVAQF